jgi:hypothetical protein
VRRFRHAFVEEAKGKHLITRSNERSRKPLISHDLALACYFQQIVHRSRSGLH